MALNSMCATACSNAARPAASNALRAGSCDGDTSGGRSGRPGRPGGSSMIACVSSDASGLIVRRPFAHRRRLGQRLAHREQLQRTAPQIHVCDDIGLVVLSFRRDRSPAQVPVRRPAGARHAGAADATAGASCCRAAPPRATAAMRSRRRCAAARRDERRRVPDARQHQVRRRADPAGVRRRAGQARSGRGAPDLGFRATAKVVGKVPPGAQLAAMLNVHGQGRCAITLDPSERRPGQQPYQGVVPLHGDRREPLQQLSQVLEHYMLQSEQLDTRLVLAADDDVRRGPADPAPAGARRCQPRPAAGKPATRTPSAATKTSTASRCWPPRSRATSCSRWRRSRSAAPVLGRDRCACFAPLEPKLRLHLLAQARGQHAARPRPRGNRFADRRARPGRGGLRLLRRAIPLRCGRRRRGVRAGAQPPGSRVVN